MKTQHFDADVSDWTRSYGPSAESVFSWEAPAIRFGLGATQEVGKELLRLGVRRALIVTDPGVAATGLGEQVRAAAVEAGVEAEVWSGTDVEPTDVSILRAVEELRGKEFDGFVGVGGGSSLDTCKAINVLLTQPGELNDYIALPHGKGMRIPGPLAPMIGIPTTAGTGSECSAVAIINLTELHVKGAISDSRIRPTLAVVDPLNTLSGPSWVTAAAGYDALIQTLESYTSTPFNQRTRPEPGKTRPLLAGSTPISDVWSERAIMLMGRHLRRVIDAPDDIDARTGMALAALFSRLGTASAHLPHSAAYAVAGLVDGYRPVEYGPGPSLVPHGMSVVVTAAAAFDYTYAAAPERHDRAADLLTGGTGRDLGSAVPVGDWLRQLVQDTKGPRGLDEFGFSRSDVPQLVANTLTQSRLLRGSPRAVDEESMTAIFLASFSQ